MAARSNPPRSPSRSGATPLPKGARIPRPFLVVWVARAIVIGGLVLFFASATVLAWAQTTAAGDDGRLNGLLTAARPTAAANSTVDQAEAAPHDPIAALLASAAITALTPRVVTDAGLLGVLGAYLMLAEAVLAGVGMWAQRRRLARTPSTYLLVRASQPTFSASSGRMAASGTPSGDQFFRAIQHARHAERALLGPRAMGGVHAEWRPRPPN